MAFPLHLGVTEAGEGEDGRVKSAVGIGALLADGIGDTIRVSLSEAPELVRQEPELQQVNVASERLDAMIAAVWSLSRSESQALFPKGLVFADSRMVTSTSFEPAPGCMISVRGKGKFRFGGTQYKTKKGRYSVCIYRYC